MLTGTFVAATGFVPIGFAQSAAGEYTVSIFAVVTVMLFVSPPPLALPFALLLPGVGPSRNGDLLSDSKRYQATGGTQMRWIHLLVVVLFAAAVLIFVVQNFTMVTMSFLGFSARAPVALLVALVYVLGMATGGSLWSLLRRSLQGSKLTDKL